VIQFEHGNSSHSENNNMGSLVMSYRIKVRLKDARSFQFVTSSGYTTSKRIHAAMWPDAEKAVAMAKSLLADNESVVAIRVVDEDGKLIHKEGEPTPPPVEFPFHEYKYLRSIRNNRGTFDVRDDDGRWGRVTYNIYHDCYEEAKRAGIRTDSFTIRGSICTIQTKGLTFSQQSNRYVEADA